MIFLGNLTQITDTKSKVGYIHYMPFDTVDGLGKTEEELSAEGVLIDSLVEPEIIEGKIYTMFVNPETKEIIYEHSDAPVQPLTPEQEIIQLKAQIADMQTAIANLQIQ